jgi:hypothetical protein
VEVADEWKVDKENLVVKYVLADDFKDGSFVAR